METGARASSRMEVLLIQGFDPPRLLPHAYNVHFPVLCTCTLKANAWGDSSWPMATINQRLQLHKTLENNVCGWVLQCGNFSLITKHFILRWARCRFLLGYCWCCCCFHFHWSKEHKSVILMLEISLILGKYIGTHTCIQAHIQHNYPRPILFFCYLQDLGWYKQNPKIDSPYEAMWCTHKPSCTFSLSKSLIAAVEAIKHWVASVSDRLVVSPEAWP